MMNKLDIIDIDILGKLVRKELEELEKSKRETVNKQCEFDLRQLNHKLEVMRYEKNND